MVGGVDLGGQGGFRATGDGDTHLPGADQVGCLEDGDRAGGPARGDAKGRPGDVEAGGDSGESIAEEGPPVHRRAGSRVGRPDDGPNLVGIVRVEGDLGVRDGLDAGVEREERAPAECRLDAFGDGGGTLIVRDVPAARIAIAGESEAKRRCGADTTAAIE